MDVVLALNERLACTPDGAIWGESSFSYSSIERYLAVFDRVKLVARIRDVDSVDRERLRVDGPRVDMLRIPYFVGPAQYVAKRRSVKQALSSAIEPGDAVILRVPAWHLTGILATRLQQSGYPYAVEVCGDAYDRLAPDAYRQLLRPLFRWWLTRRTQQVCRRAAGALYVTDHALQKRYPAAATAHSVGCSDVALPEAAFTKLPREFTARQEPWKLVFVGSLSQPYKAPDVLIEAVARCIQSGRRIQLTLIGAGELQPALKQLAARLGVSENVRQLGQLKAGERIRAELDDSDLFVLPSHQEGLPRAMVEAMARGLPCIGSTVGGIPELLADEDMVPPGDIQALAAKISEVTGNPQRMSRMSAANLARANDFDGRTLDERRNAFYVAIKQSTEDGLAQLLRSGGGPPHSGAARHFAPVTTSSTETEARKDAA